MTLFEIFQEFHVWKKFSLTAISALIFLNVVLWRYDEDCFPFVLQTWKKISFFQIWNEKEWLIFINTKLAWKYVDNDRTLCLWCTVIRNIYSVQLLKPEWKIRNDIIIVLKWITTINDVTLLGHYKFLFKKLLCSLQARWDIIWKIISKYFSVQGRVLYVLSRSNVLIKTTKCAI